MQSIDPRKRFFTGLYIAAGFLLALFLVHSFGLSAKPGAIRRLHRQIGEQQENLIRAQITSQQLRYVQELIDKNLAYSAHDSLAEGASLSFLKDLTGVLDLLRINLLSLEPQSVIKKPDYVETPYRLEMVCNFRQLCELVNKMEKSPRLISISEIELKNSWEDYFSDKRIIQDQCQVSLLVTTLTLIKRKS